MIMVLLLKGNKDIYNKKMKSLRERNLGIKRRLIKMIPLF